MVDRIEVKGIREFRTALKKADADAPKMIRVTLNGAADVVLDYARPRIPSRSGAARQSLKARSSQKDVRVAVGGKKAPYYPWLDFGGHVGPNDSVSRPFITEGRYIYPALRVKRDDVTKVMSEGLAALATSAGLDVTGE